MPSLVYVLQQNQKGEQAAGASNDKDLLQSVAEFGTIFIYSCSVSCWDESNPQFREEIVILQPDLDAVHVDKF